MFATGVRLTLPRLQSPPAAPDATVSVALREVAAAVKLATTVLQPAVTLKLLLQLPSDAVTLAEPLSTRRSEYSLPPSSTMALPKDMPESKPSR